ncbi:MAG: type VI secretion system tip protein TssI/VgrG, partial [Nitrospirales bacterium]
MPYTQANRLIAIDTPLGEDVLLLRGFTGQEGISQLFNFELELLSEDHAIKFEDIIGQRTTIRVILGGDSERFFNGFISRFAQVGTATGLVTYQATMVPWLWFLTRTSDCRMFQNESVPDIIMQVFQDLGFTDVRNDLQGTYEPREYCVQYRETDFNFVSRLMEQYGIFYFFEHEEEKHTLVLADAASVHQPCSGQETARCEPHGGAALVEDVITNIQVEQSLRPGKYALTEYNFETPSTSLGAEVDTTVAVGGNGQYEIFDYPGEYKKKADGESLVKIRMEEEEAQHLVVTGTSTCRAFTTGYRFDLVEHTREDLNKTYVLTDVQHSASVGDTYSTGSVGGGEADYTNSFTCIPHTVPFRPPQVTPKPVVQGPQTAVVVGKKGEEIWTDKYGRVKVKFHWDRESSADENSSCWIRVAQTWAGKRWGAIFIPR